MMQVGKALTSITGRSWLKVCKYSPEILVIGGVVGGVTAAVMAVKATASPKYLEIKAAHEEALKDIDETFEMMQHPEDLPDAVEQMEYTEKDRKLDRISTYRKTTWDLVKLYGPSVLLGTASIVSILGGFSIIRKRYLGVMGAYALVDKTFKDYRGRVVNELGVDKDQQFMYDTETKTSTKTVVNEDGTTTKVKETEHILKGEKVSMYARLFGEGYTDQWTRQAGMNWLTLKKDKDYFNDILRIRGHVFLNEIYDQLGYDRTPEGAVVGWIWKGEGDSYISFGPWCEKITDVEAEGPHGNVLLDFNVDGVIWDKI